MPTLEVGPCESADAPGTGLGLVVLAVDGVEKFSPLAKLLVLVGVYALLIVRF